MDRALDPRLLAGALGDLTNLPTPARLRAMLADAEVDAFFAGNEPLDLALLETAWNLHHVGTTRPALALYGIERQVQANAVAAHIFDLALRDAGMPNGERLVVTFAAQVSSIRGDRSPNATALARRLPPPVGLLSREPGHVSLELGCAILALNRKTTMDLLRKLQAQVNLAQLRAEGRDLRTTGLAAAVDVVTGCRLLQRYLTYGDAAELDAARAAFERAANPPAALRDLDSRWVAAHLLDLSDDLGQASVWALLPTGTPPATGRAMTLGDPPVMTLWPPQMSLLAIPERSPLNHDVRRAVITYPTSAGKTLLTQLVVAEHVAARNTGVCVVAPTHSLCREIRRGLDNRLWPVRKHIAEDGPLGFPEAVRAPVVVMTPERLAGRMRASETDLLAEFELFVLDEAHLVSDRGRGWTFETTIARLHELTRGTSHRLILVSAAMGGTASVRTWLDVDAPPTSESVTWRAPRRLHATYTTRQGPARKFAPKGRERVARTIRELHGVVELFVDHGQAVARRSAPLGDVVQVGRGKPKKPPIAEQLQPIVELAAAGGPVLTVHASKASAERLALQLAEGRPPKAEATALVQLAELRLHRAHPLIHVLGSGVAYHHAALPLDVQAEIEDAVRSGVIDIVCATTTLTEGVNLPVRTVIICERGYMTGEGFQQQIGHADLLNAAGRAGRAGRETEGWVVVVHQAGGPNARSALIGLDSDEDIHSTLATMEALGALGEYEEVLAKTADLVLSDVPSVVDGFLAYCWYLADAADVLTGEPRAAAVLSGIQHTLAWQQLTPPLRSRWQRVAEMTAAAYEAEEPLRRRRWARTGADLSANVVLERVATAASAAAPVLAEDRRGDPVAVASLLLADGRLGELLSLVDERDRRFKRRRYGAVDVVDVDAMSLVLDWLAGFGLTELAERYLAEVGGEDDDGFRHDQLSRFLTNVCEHHLPWTLATILEWVKESTGIELCPDLPAFLHYGLNRPVALNMMLGGVRSRRLACVVADEAAGGGLEPGDVRTWLAELGVPGWRSDFGAGIAEVADLLQFVRDPQRGMSAELLEGRTVTVAATAARDDIADGEELHIDYVSTGDHPRPLAGLRRDGALIATMRASEHHDLAVLVDAGFRLHGRLRLTDDQTTIEVRVEDE